MDVRRLINQFDELATDDTAMLEIYNLFGKIIEPYVPMDEGVLAHGYEITPNYIRYPGPYAHYMYMGEIYGPNIPITDKNGDIIGWRSPPGKGSKYPTGREITYSKEKHEKASKEWDKAAMIEKKDEFLAGVKNILIRRARELYGG